jgi:hypothetical protein
MFFLCFVKFLKNSANCRCQLTASDGESVERGVAVSRVRVSDGAWHRALVRRSGRRLYVRLDDREVFRDVVGGRTAKDMSQGEESLHTDGQLWIGELLCLLLDNLKWRTKLPGTL